MFFFFNDTATTEIYTLSLHDALPICDIQAAHSPQLYKQVERVVSEGLGYLDADTVDRKSTRLNSSHSQISYAVFCLKKKKKKKNNIEHNSIIELTNTLKTHTRNSPI